MSRGKKKTTAVKQKKTVSCASARIFTQKVRSGHIDMNGSISYSSGTGFGNCINYHSNISGTGQIGLNSSTFAQFR